MMKHGAELFGELEFKETFAKGGTSSVGLYKVKGKELLIVGKAIDVAKARQDASIIDQVNRERAALDALAAGQEHCPFIVNSFGACKDDHCLYFLLEFVSGGELFKHIAAAPQKRLPISHVQVYLAQISSAISFMHDRGWVYRDLKANNIVVSENGSCVLIDFGRSKHIGVGSAQRTNTFLGVGHHSSPEMARGEPHGFAVDWWQLGVLLHEMLTGHPFVPYRYTSEKQDEIAYIEKICKGVSREDLSQYPFLSEPLKTLLLSLLEINQGKRAAREEVLSLIGSSVLLEPPPLPFFKPTMRTTQQNTAAVATTDPFQDW